MEDFLDDEMKDKLRRLVAQFGRPLTEAEKRKWLYGIEDEPAKAAGLDDMLSLMTGQATESDQADKLADEMGVSPQNAKILLTYYRENKYARPDMETNWRSLDYLQRKTGLPQQSITKILKSLRLKD